MLNDTLWLRLHCGGPVKIVPCGYGVWCCDLGSCCLREGEKFVLRSPLFSTLPLSIKCKRFVINKKCTSLVLHPGLPSRCWWFPGPAVFSPCRRAVPGSVPRVAACVQRSRQPLRTQVQGKEFGSRGGAGAQGSGWDPLLHRVFGHVHQWSLPGRRKI